ncbi:MAG TPA: hypothetical protein VG713_00105 [Pirellulales bacterium]|nr:hypothetical protein [Pirellulales bacterium]
MILFLDEDRAYLNWVTHHRGGFVLDCSRHPAKAHLVLHRARCAEVKQAANKRTHWTTGKHMKGCAIDAAELVQWAEQQTGHAPACCAICGPDRDLPANDGAEHHLTHLEREILSYVLEIAAYHLDADDHAYTLTVGMVARCLGKTEGQLTAAFQRLIDGELLTVSRALRPGEFYPPRTGVLPTAQALRTLEYYSDFNDKQLAGELQKLQHA